MTSEKENEISNESAKQPKKKQTKPFKLFVKFFAWVFFSFIALLGVLVLLALVYEDEIKQEVIKKLNKNLKAEVNVKQIDFSIIKKFPNASIDFNDVSIKSAPYKGSEKNPFWKRNLITAQHINLQFNVLNLLSKNYQIKKVELEDATINLLFAPNNKNNFDIIKEDSTSTDSEAVNFKLDAVELNKVVINYYDPVNRNYIEVLANKALARGNFYDENYSVATDGNFYVKQIKIDNTTWVSKKKLITEFNLDVTDNEKFTFKPSVFSIEKLNFELNGEIKTPEKASNYVDLTIKGKDINIGHLLSILPASMATAADEYETNGMLSFSTTIKGKINDKINPVIKSQFEINGGTILHKESKVSLSNIYFIGKLNSFENQTDQRNLFSLENVSAELGKGKIKASLQVTNFKQPVLSLKSNAKISLADFLDFTKMDTLENASGNLEFEIDYKGEIKSKQSLKEINLKDADLAGKLIVSDARFKLKGGKFDFTDINADITSNRSDVVLNKLAFKAGNSDFKLQGELFNLLSFLFYENEALKVNADMTSDYIDLTEILSDKNKTTENDTAFKFRISDKFDVDLDCNINKLKFESFSPASIQGKFILQQKQIKLQDFSFNAMEGSVKTNTFINATNDKFFEVKCAADLDKINITKLMAEFNNFGQTAITDKNLKGKLTSSILFYGKWNSDLSCITSSITSSANISIIDGELLDFEPMQNLSRFISVDELKHIRFSELKNTIEINNRIITIPGMFISSSALDVFASGTHSFDNFIDYHFKVKMADLLFRKAKAKKQDLEDFAEEEVGEKKSINLYISMYGPIDDPKIKYDKQGFKKTFKEIKTEEKNTVKNLLNEEFGWFKNQTTNTTNKTSKGSEPKMEWSETQEENAEKNKTQNDLPKIKEKEKTKEKESLFDKKKKGNKAEKKEKTQNADEFN